jgi:hypothetical protein
VEGTSTGHEDAEGMASVGVRLTAQLGFATKLRKFGQVLLQPIVAL